jgi:peptide/nickel transport system permease protein
LSGLPKFVLLWTDVAVWLMALGLLGYALHVRRRLDLRQKWRRVFQDRGAMGSSVVLAACLLLTLLDSVHYRPVLPPVAGQGGPVLPVREASQAVAYDVKTRSVLDALLWKLAESREATYSRPLASESFTKESVAVDGRTERRAPRLLHGGAHLKDPEAQAPGDILQRAALGAGAGLLGSLALLGALCAWAARWRGRAVSAVAQAAWSGQGGLPWKVAGLTFTALAVLTGVCAALSGAYHVLGTDQTGNDVLYQALKSVRTAFVIGTLTTLTTLPVAVGLGIAAGYWRGWLDEAVQYLYTVLSSVPNVLLIAACVLMVQVFLDQHPELFETGAERADLKLFLLCAVLGLTGWAGLCRLVRAETLKQRELDYVRAAHAFGVGHARIMARHIFPNVAHLMLIVTVLEFSALILYEAVLSYVGVGVDPSMNSFGGMINLARSEMSRDPLVWWSFAAAFGFMVTIVLAANLLADGVQRAFDPRGQSD